MKGRKHIPEQIVCKLREAARPLGEGENAAEVSKELASANTPSVASETSTEA